MTRQEFGQLLNLETNLIPKGKRNRPGKSNKAKYITIHNTGNANKTADADAHANFLNRRGYYELKGKKIWVSWNYTVDDNKVVKHLPVNEMGYHSKSGNKKSIGIEICMHKGIDQEAAFLRAARLAAILLFDLKSLNGNFNRVVPHYRWTKKNCPVLLLDDGKPGKKWDKFKQLILSEFVKIEK